MALDLTVALGGNGLRTTVGYVSLDNLGKVIPATGTLQPFEFDDKKQFVPFAFHAAVAPLLVDPQFRERMKLWVDPDGSMIRWWGSNRQVGRLLYVREKAFPLLDTVKQLIPENLVSKEKPQMLEIADLLSYSAARALAKQGKAYDHVFEQIFRLTGAVQYPFQWVLYQWVL